MTVNVDDNTLPVDNSLSSPASEGAGELRALKAKLNNLFLNTGVSATYAGLIDTNGKGINVNIIDASNTPLYSGRFKVTRSATQSQDTLGMYSEAVLNNGISTPGKILSSFYSLVTTGTSGGPGAVYCLNSGVYQQNHNPGFLCIGFYLNFADRTTIGAAAPGGFGSNRYNVGSIGIALDSFGRSSSGEFCGWKTGIKFLPGSIDADINGKGWGIDFQGLITAGLTADPRTSYQGLKSAIRLGPMMSISWDTAEDVMTYYDPATTRWVLRYQNNLIFQVDVITGAIYRNGVALP